MVAAASALAAFAVSALPGGASGAGPSGGSSKVGLTFEKGTATSAPTVWVATGAGHAQRRLGGGDEPLISPSGAYVASSPDASSGSALTIFSTHGGAKHGFFNEADVYAIPLGWSYDSRYLAVSLQGVGVNPVTGAGLAVIDTATMTATMVAHGLVSGASFSPRGIHTSPWLVYGLAHSESLTAKVNLFVAGPSFATVTQLSSDGRSLNPLWTRKGIVFDRERLRLKEGYPAYQLWLDAHGLRQLTHMKIGQLVSGLFPVSASSSGNRLLATYIGQDTDYAWRVQISPLRVNQIKVAGDPVQGGAVSTNGRRLLVDQGAFMRPPSDGRVEWIPFSGGRAHPLAHGADPSWNA